MLQGVAECVNLEVLKGTNTLQVWSGWVLGPSLCRLSPGLGDEAQSSVLRRPEGWVSATLEGRAAVDRQFSIQQATEAWGTWAK